MAVTMIPGQVVDLTLPARLRVTAEHMPDDLRVTAMVLSFAPDGSTREDVGTAEDLDRTTLKAELVLERPREGDRQTMLLVVTRHGVEVPMSDAPPITITVDDGSELYSWSPISSANRTTILLETYLRNDRYRLRSVDQGYAQGWSAFVARTSCPYDLPSILSATLEESSKPRPDVSKTLAPSTTTVLDLESEIRRLGSIVSQLERRAATLRDADGAMRSNYDRMVARVKQLDGAEEVLQYAELGVYEPRFDYDDSERYRSAIVAVKASQRDMIDRKTAVVSNARWTIGGDEKEGRRMTDRQIKLTLRAFNGEADAAIAKVRWDTAVAMERRIRTAAETIDKANTSIQVHISSKYVDLKVKELRLTHEQRDAVKRERDEASEQRRAQRDQDRLEREVEKAEREERKYQALLDRARSEAQAGDDTQSLRDRIARLESEAASAAQAHERTKAMAEQTKCGFVYVISNVGSFGEGVVKIGMTRRLDPEDRVRELSSASVPFSFDIHAMIYSVVASDLEATLHAAFDDRRINASNSRKEFFRCSVEEVEEAVYRLKPDARFTRDRDAREWRETVALRRHKLVGSNLVSTKDPRPPFRHRANQDGAPRSDRGAPSVSGCEGRI